VTSAVSDGSLVPRSLDRDDHRRRSVRRLSDAARPTVSGSTRASGTLNFTTGVRFASGVPSGRHPRRFSPGVVRRSFTLPFDVENAIEF
jgi:hypothetical protein